MPFAAALSVLPDTRAAAAEACGQSADVMTARPDLAVAFFTPEHDADVVFDELRTRIGPAAVLGCSAQGVLAGGREIERGPALSLWLAKWPHPVRQTPFHLTMERTADGPSLFGRPDALLESADNGPRAALLLGDPYSFPADQFLQRLNEDNPGLPVLGGMASGARQPGQVRLLGEGVYHEGAVGLLLEGDCGLRPVVSQGCRPIGRPMVITRGEENVIQELGGLSPMDQLRELYRSLGPEEQMLFQKGLHVGRVASEYGGDFRRGDFLIRNVVGLERTNGALIVGDRVRVGQTVQFQVRDAASATGDLLSLLRQGAEAQAGRPAAALVFTCNGRGTHLFGAPDHDAAAVRQVAGPVPLAGFFAAGEIGPVAGRNFVHGFTASVALFGGG